MKLKNQRKKLNDKLRHENEQNQNEQNKKMEK